MCLLHFTYGNQLQPNAAEQTFTSPDCCQGNRVLSHSSTDVSQKLFIYMFLLRHCTVHVMKITYVKQVYVLDFDHVFLKYICRSITKYYLFSHSLPTFLCLQIPGLIGSFYHIWHLRALLPCVCSLYFDLTVEKITLFLRKEKFLHLKRCVWGSWVTCLA